jgi:MinD-like ATPase involved in chromosome partitioning or flagellar assembly
VLVTCWSVKGGSGTTVVAAALAVLLSRRLPSSDGGVLLVDAGGDLGAALGLAEPGGAPGLTDWLEAPADVGPGSLDRLVVPVGSGLSLLPRGSSRPVGSSSVRPGASAERLLDAMAGRPLVVVDAGPPSSFAVEVAAASTLSLLVIRPCYLALRRALAAPVRPSGVVVVEEPKRSLDALDIEDVLGVPVQAVVPWSPDIARAVDAGLLGARLPRTLATALRAAA